MNTTDLPPDEFDLYSTKEATDLPPLDPITGKPPKQPPAYTGLAAIGKAIDDWMVSKGGEFIGLTFMLVIGRWAKPQIQFDGKLRICLGYIAFILVPFDVEIAIFDMLAEIKKMQAALQALGIKDYDNLVK